jgi:PAS domain S-box-containing protein
MTLQAGGFSLGGGSRYFRALLDSLLDAVVIADEHGVVWGYNEAAGRLFGFAPGEVFGRPIALLMPLHCWRPDLAFADRPSGQGGREAVRQQVDGWRKNGHRYRCELDLTGFVVDGQRYVVGVARELAEQGPARDAAAVTAMAPDADEPASPAGITGQPRQDPV